MRYPYKTENGTEFYYDSLNTVLFTKDMEPLYKEVREPDPEFADRFGQITKSNKPATLRISLGQACNYSCSYCSQKDLGDPSERPPRLASMTFVDKLQRTLDLTEIEKIEVWGGETLLYWNDIQNIMDNLDKPGLTWYIPTNGTPLMMKHVEYLANLKGRVGIGISHDGPGHVALRGPEFLHKKVQVLQAIQETQGQVQYSFNPVISSGNYDLMAFNEFFRNFLGENGLNNVSMNFELCRAYGDQGSASNVIQGEDLVKYRQSLRNFLDAHLKQFRDKGYIKSGEMLVSNLFHTGMGVVPLAKSFNSNIRPFVQTNCGVDDSRLLSVELDGTVKVCQNTDSRYAKGNLDQLNEVVMSGVLFRSETMCHECPVSRLCKGSCPIDVGSENFLLNHNAELVHYTEILLATFRLLFGQNVYPVER